MIRLAAAKTAAKALTSRTAIVLGSLFVLGFVTFMWKSAVEENGALQNTVVQYRQTAEDNAAALKRQKAEYQRLQDVLERREAEKERLLHEKAELTRNLEEAKNNASEEVKVCMDTVIPDSILGVLRGEAGTSAQSGSGESGASRRSDTGSP